LGQAFSGAEKHSPWWWTLPHEGFGHWVPQRKGSEGGLRPGRRLRRRPLPSPPAQGQQDNGFPCFGIVNAVATEPFHPRTERNQHVWASNQSGVHPIETRPFTLRFAQSRGGRGPIRSPAHEPSCHLQKDSGGVLRHWLGLGFPPSAIIGPDKAVTHRHVGRVGRGRDGETGRRRRGLWDSKGVPIPSEFLIMNHTMKRESRNTVLKMDAES